MSLRRSCQYIESNAPKYYDLGLDNLQRYGIKQEEVENMIQIRKIKRVYPKFLTPDCDNKNKTNRQHSHKKHYHNNYTNNNSSAQFEETTEDFFVMKRSSRRASATNQRKSHLKKGNDSISNDEKHIRKHRRQSESPKNDQKSPRNSKTESSIVHEKKNFKSTKCHHHNRKFSQTSSKQRSHSIKSEYTQTDCSFISFQSETTEKNDTGIVFDYKKKSLKSSDLNKEEDSASTFSLYQETNKEDNETIKSLPSSQQEDISSPNHKRNISNNQNQNILNKTKSHQRLKKSSTKQCNNINSNALHVNEKSTSNDKETSNFDKKDQQKLKLQNIEKLQPEKRYGKSNKKSSSKNDSYVENIKTKSKDKGSNIKQRNIKKNDKNEIHNEKENLTEPEYAQTDSSLISFQSETTEKNDTGIVFDYKKKSLKSSDLNKEEDSASTFSLYQETNKEDNETIKSLPSSQQEDISSPNHKRNISNNQNQDIMNKTKRNNIKISDTLHINEIEASITAINEKDQQKPKLKQSQKQPNNAKSQPKKISEKSNKYDNQDIMNKAKRNNNKISDTLHINEKDASITAINEKDQQKPKLKLSQKQLNNAKSQPKKISEKSNKYDNNKRGPNIENSDTNIDQMQVKKSDETDCENSSKRRLLNMNPKHHKSESLPSLEIDHHSLLIDQKSEVEYHQLYDQKFTVDNHHHQLIIDHKSKVEHHYQLSDHQYESESQSEADTCSTNILICQERNADFEQTEAIRKNKEMYLRWLVKITDEHPIRIDEIPKEFIDVFTIPGLSQALNIAYNYQPSIEYSKVEEFIDNYLNNYDKIEDNESISRFDHLAQQIKENINSNIDKIYACFYFVTHHVRYDHERSLLKGKDRKDLSIENIIEIQKGVCSDYSVLYRELVKRSGVKTEQIPIYRLTCASKAAGYNNLNPPKEPDYDHESNIIKINNEYFISESTWGAGHNNKNDEFDFDYNKSYFLIPYYKGLLTHFPENIIDEKLNKVPYSWDNFIDLNKPSIQKELSIESNPFQMIKVEDGFYDMQISLIQPVYRLSGKLYLIKENCKIEQETNLVTYTCLAKDIPNHQFSFSSEKRCRYKISVHFHEIGNYLLETYSQHNEEDGICSMLFETCFEVNQIKSKSIDIEMINNEKYSFYPIIPKTGLTKVSDGYARIRFAIKWENSPILIESFITKDNAIYRYTDNNTILYHHYFTAEIPFIKYDWTKSNDFLVENWVLIKFPENGKWKIDIYFKNKGINEYSKGASYCFEVEGSEKKCPSPLFDLPKNRKFAPFIEKVPEKLLIDPPTNTVILYSYDFYFHLFCDKDLSAIFMLKDQSILFPKLIKKKKSNKENIYDFEYSVTFPRYDEYELKIVCDEKCIGTQYYFVLKRNNLPKEKESEQILMNELKIKLDDKYDYNSDIPIFIQNDVETMLQFSKNNK